VLRAIPERAQITVAIPDDQGGQSLATWTDVMPGASLELHDTSDRRADDPVVQVNLPELPMEGRYSGVDLGCVGSSRVRGQTYGTPVPASCLDAEGRVNVLALAYGRRRALLGYAMELDVPVAPPATDVFLSDWRTDWHVFDVSIGGVPVDALSLSLSTVMLRGGQRYSGGIAFLQLQQQVTSAPSETMVQLPAGFAESLEHTITARVPFRGGPGQSQQTVRVGGPVADGYFELSMVDALPPITNVAVDAAADAERPTIAWRISGDPAGEDALLLTMYWGAGNDQARWTFLVSPQRSEPLRVPLMPDVFAALRPSSNTQSHAASAYLLDVEGMSDYETYQRAVGPRSPPSSQIKRSAFAYGSPF